MVHTNDDLGAEVIKFEAMKGDITRSRPPLRGGASTAYGMLNDGKQCIVLDLKRKTEAREAVLRLLETSDILVENFRPGVMRRFGLEYETLSH